MEHFSSESLNSYWQIVVDKAVPWGMNVLGVIVLIIIGLFVASWASKLSFKLMKRCKLDETIARALASLVKWLVIILIIICCLSMFGVQTTSFAALIGALGLAIGLAFQGTMSNFAAGVMILIFRPFVIGNVVKVNGEIGKVIEINPFETILDTPDNRRIIMPNSKIYGNTIMNISYHETRRVDVSVGVDYGADLEKVREALVEAAQVEGVTDASQTAIIMQEFGDSAITWDVRVWCKGEDYFTVRERLVVSIKKTLDKHGVNIPFPHIQLINK